MLEINQISKLKEQIAAYKTAGKSIALVPTMGYLHAGHGSLIARAREENDIVVVSIFVNPMQFAPNEDLDKYPRNLAADLEYCQNLGVDLVFAPTPEEMYPAGFSSFADVYTLGDNLCGAKRAGHFRGVCTVLLKLFNIARPDRAYFGQKDAQQVAIIKRIVKDFNFDVQIKACPLIREEDGLAKSSRNVYLSPEQRQAALILFRAVQLGQKLVAAGEKNTQTILQQMRELISTEKLAKIDYLQAVNMETMQDVDSVAGQVLFAMAVFIGETRLIDNFIVE